MLASDLRKDMKEGEAAIKAEVQSQRQVMGTIQDSHKDSSNASRSWRTAPPWGVSTTAEPINVERHKFTLICGWSRDTARATITSELHAALQAAGVAQCTDNPRFTTGPRESIALLQFRVRSPAEDYQAVRERMQHVVSTVNCSALTVKGGGSLWSGFSSLADS